MNQQDPQPEDSRKLLIGSTTRLNVDRAARLAETILGIDLTLNCDLMSREDCSILITATSEEQLADKKMATLMARDLMGFFRKVEFQDPYRFSVALAGLFMRYPPSLGREVCDPIDGLPGRLRFPPSLAEVKEALDGKLAERRAIAYRARWMLEESVRREQEAERDRERSDPEEVERRRKLVEEMFSTTATTSKRGDHE